jgi:4-amino-4-deoxy-L-arabinose transferase-like glycosyltransferase
MICLGLSVLFAVTAGMHTYLQWDRLINPPVAALAWGLGVILAVIGGGPGESQPASRPRWGILFWVTLFVAGGFVVRAFDLEHLPALSGDEGSSGLTAALFVSGQTDNLFSIGWHGFPALYYYLQSWPIHFLGQTATAIRISSAFAGALTVGALYLMGRSLFGHRVGVLAAILLAALHFHIHFSRIALNNVWDGLTYVVTLGALWYGWQTERRAAYLLAGLGLGFSQYFYPSARLLIGLVSVWLILVGLLDRARFKRALPSLLLMGLIAFVIVLPLAWFYSVRLDEFWGAIRVQSALPAITAEAQETGNSVVLLLLRQIGLGLLAFAVSPLQWFYRPGTAILRLFPAVFFMISVAALALRWRDSRALLLLLWLVTFGLIGGLSESTPAAQRYVASAPVCALLAGYGLTLVIDALPKLWPRLASITGCLAISAALLMAADDVQFYFLRYAPESYFGGQYDFEGQGAAVAWRLGDYLRRQSDEWQVLFFGSPTMGFYSIPSLQFLAPGKVGLDMNFPWGAAENPKPSSNRLIFVFLSNHADDLAAVQASYPGGLLVPTYGNLGQLVYTLYQYPPPAATDSQLGGDDIGLLVRVLGLILLAALGVALAWMWGRLQKSSLGVHLQPVLAVANRALGAQPEQPKPAAPAFASVGLAAPEPIPVPTTTPPPPPALAVADQGADTEPKPAEPSLESGGSAASEPTSGQLPQPALALNPAPAPEPAAPTSNEATLPAKPLASPADLEANPPATVTVIPTATNTARVTLEVPMGAIVRVTIETALAQPGQPGQGTVNIQPSKHQATLGEGVPTPSVALSASLVPWSGAFQTRFAQAFTAIWDRLRARVVPLQLDTVLFGLSLAVYLLTRVVGLDRFPIYFFTDEAIQTVQAENFVHSGFTNGLGEFLPTYFQNGPFWNLSVSVYLQVVPYLLFGKSILVNRGVSVLVTWLGAWAVGLILKDIFKARYWWAGVLVLSVTPAWFLHSRTAFEAVEMASFYAVFLYFYLSYRYRSPKYLYAAAVAGALAFYSYSPGQLVMAVTGLLLFFSDLRYHWQKPQRPIVAGTLVLLAVLALPYVRFQVAHPEAAYLQLRERGSQVLNPNVPLSERIGQPLSEYAYGLSLAYWFFPNDRDLVRHVMKGYGNLLNLSLPLALLGVVLALKNFRSSAHRAVLIALLASPTGGALAEIGLPRLIMFVIPAALLTSLGLIAVLNWLEEKARLPQPALAVAVFTALSGFNLYMLSDALTNGPTWFTDYGLYGMQYGARELFQEVIPSYLEQDLRTNVIVSPSWANGADHYITFFVPAQDQGRVAMRNVDYYLYDKRDLSPTDLLIMTPEEYERAHTDPKFKAVQVEQVLYYPDGNPGFYFTRLAYVDNIDEIVANEQAERRKPVEDTAQIDGQTVTVIHSRFGDGEVVHLFDGDTFTLMRGEEANPLAFDFHFPAPRPATGLTLTTGSMADYTVTVHLYPPGGEQPVTFSQNYLNQPNDPTIRMTFEGGPAEVARLELLITDNLSGEKAQTHVREIKFER